MVSRARVLSSTILATKAMRILLAEINPTIGDLHGNLDKVLRAISKGKESKADLVLFPEMTLSGYPPEDFLLLPDFVDDVMKTLNKIVPETQGIAVVVGLVRRNPALGEKSLCNSAAIIENGAAHL